ncbi:MAG: VOC family protein [Alphaproteobacteria bacterium]|nr:VOC family protein [Alphaproteobacteria bacterium]MBL7098180.1 VOC family protein [Alphaproteobacteria bacterium]
MIGYVTIGAKDSEASGRFYDSVLGACGNERKFADGGWIGYGVCGDDNHSVYVCPPFNKEPATFGNGMMIAFKAHSIEQVDAAHAAGLQSGGSDEGKPGYRPPEKQSWYGAYLRDPTGNKIAIYCTP